MKRSEIDAAIGQFLDFAAGRQFPLPPWAYYTPKQWARLGPEADEIRRAGLGWDVTDFGSGRFAEMGLTLITLRNGPLTPAGATDKDYCEKLMMVREKQLTPCHFHFAKMEDIINRGGGRLVIRLYAGTADERLDEASAVAVQVDGITRTFPAGGELELSPGESVTLPPRLYHAFWGAAGAGCVLVGEVSRVNDDARDNRFAEPLPRFPQIEEDAPARYVLCTEYPAPGE
ncbi:MAG TPA: D-lyxose/D-mannose family sugar isomerase [Phycisphaerae bacterium]|nr:D-lyxose/D-mannose family sugar isomerase [Phycisphaerae bacterium]